MRPRPTRSPTRPTTARSTRTSPTSTSRSTASTTPRSAWTSRSRPTRTPPARTAPSCTDADGETLTYTVTAAATGISGTDGTSTLTYDPNGQFEYLDTGETATDAFTYTANDGTVDSNVADVDVTINGVNDAPVCLDVTITTDEDTAGSTAPSCTDADGETLTYTVTAAATGISGTDGTSTLTYDPNGQFEYLDTG